MGSCLTNDQNTRIIDFKLKENEKYEKSCHKLLFLGPGGGGKSTIFKQLQYLHGDGFIKEAIDSLVSHINMQIIIQMRVAIKHYLSQQTADTILQKHINTVIHYDISDEGPMLTQQLTESIAYILKNDDRLNGIFDTYNDQQIMWPTTQYFWNALERITALDYVPTKQDIIQVRNMSTGVVQKRFNINQNNFHIFDVGGQKSERKKWIRCFDGVTIVIFVVALSSYHELMFEDQKTNCMVDAVNLFENTIHDSQFIETPIILLLNKIDLFERKIKTIPITVCPIFDDYDEKTVYKYDEYDDVQKDYLNEAAYIKTTFEEINRSPRRVYTHLTCAMNDTNIDHVFDDVVNVVVSELNNKIKKYFV